MADSLQERNRALNLVRRRLQGVLDHATAVIYIKDADAACEIDGFDTAARDELLAIFEHSTAGYLSGLERALAAGDREETIRLAHQLKGSGAALGARTLSDACRALEVRVRDGADGRWPAPRSRGWPSSPPPRRRSCASSC